MAEKLVITISRQYGTGGKKIGKRLADELDINCYDSEMFRLISKNENMHDDSFADDDRISGTSIFDVAKRVYDSHPREELPEENETFTDTENLYLYQTAIIRELADRESCVIVGRCANYILKDRPNTLKVFIHAPIDYRYKRIRSLYDMDETMLLSYIRGMDKHKADYYRHYTGAEWSDASYYDISIDSGRLGISGSVDAIKKYIDGGLNV